ncbi:YtpR family tRNA-binding protein [Bombilactobacillus bombi]|uniref:YtpR family tRNA-binding protein n=1 Tax=Bombilactobacillus bombi TaxID=1303590 RepID=UPI0015E61DBC|nr:DUF4479 domain-containing protein [Bombilactobacillus bombi]MBA1434575.1 DUF4479 domain-containing protein [Bombilactobacillus bombi]
MLVSSYNPEVLGDVLLVVTGADDFPQEQQQKDDIVQIINHQKNVIGYNFFNIAQQLQLTPANQGQVFLNAQQIQILNERLKNAGFHDKLTIDLTPKFVVGYVQEMKAHPNSDHLHICQVELDAGQVEQIVCGAPNVDQGQKVVVAKVGAMMPNGQIIFPGQLRKVASNGMLCSARELGLDNAPQQRGIMVLDSRYQVGDAINLQELNQNYK